MDAANIASAFRSGGGIDAAEAKALYKEARYVRMGDQSTVDSMAGLIRSAGQDISVDAAHAMAQRIVDSYEGATNPQHLETPPAQSTKAYNDGFRSQLGGRDVMAFDPNQMHFQTRIEARQALKQATIDASKPENGDALIEQTVAKNVDLTTVKTLDQLSDLQSRMAFLERTPQVDGDVRTTSDAGTCGPMALLGSVFLEKPEAVQAMAAKLLGPDVGQHWERFQTLRDGAPEVHEALENLAAGRFSPDAMTKLSQALLDSIPSFSSGGTKPAEMQTIVGHLVSLGIELPDVRLIALDNPAKKGAGGHWVGQTQGKASGLVFDSSIHEGGRAAVDTLPRNQAQRNYTLAADLALRDGGRTLTLRTYDAGTTTWSQQANANPTATTYRLQGDAYAKSH